MYSVKKRGPDGRFITEKDPTALVDFYQAEELLHIIAVFPIFFSLFMDKVRGGAAGCSL